MMVSPFWQALGSLRRYQLGGANLITESLYVQLLSAVLVGEAKCYITNTPNLRDLTQKRTFFCSCRVQGGHSYLGNFLGQPPLTSGLHARLMSPMSSTWSLQGCCERGRSLFILAPQVFPHSPIPHLGTLQSISHLYSIPARPGGHNHYSYLQTLLKLLPHLFGDPQHGQLSFCPPRWLPVTSPPGMHTLEWSVNWTW